MQLPTATCSACGAAVSVSGREEKDVKFSTDTEAGTEKTQIHIHVESCGCIIAEGQEKYVNLKFGDLDEMPEVVLTNTGINK